MAPVRRIAPIAVAILVLSSTTLVSAQTVPKCSAADESFCPYGYTNVMVAAGDVVGTTPTVALCCERDDGIPSFPVCTDTTSGGTGAVQASTLDETSWGVQDGAGFTRTVGRFTGMCFTVLIDNNECTGDDKCCTTKAPAYVQFKLPTAKASGLNSKCKLSYGNAVTTVNGVKRITKWSADIGSTNAIKMVNLPISFRKGAKTATVCLYSTYAYGPTFDCSFENMCGFGTTRTTSPVAATVPSDDGSYAAGCEFRVVGRRSAASSACCAPTFSVESFDSTNENRLAGGAPATSTIELTGA